MLKLGKFYEKGKGANKDETIAFKYYRKAVKKGCNEAIVSLANCYEAGIGVK
jgi:TPR repeat protein